MRVVFNLLAILILTSISSCSGWKTNFNTQKYTSLNKIKQKNHETFDTLNVAVQNAHANTPETATTVNYVESQNTATLENANNETHIVQSHAVIDNNENLRDEQIKFRPLLPLIHAKGNYWSNTDWNKQDKNYIPFSKKIKSKPGTRLLITLLIISIILILTGVIWALLPYASNMILFLSLAGLIGTLWTTLLLINRKNYDKNQKIQRKKNNKRIALGIGLFFIAVFVALLAFVSMELGGIEVAIALIVVTMAILALSIHQFIRAIKGDKKKKSKANSKIWGIIVLTLGCILMVLGPLLIMAVSAYWIPIFFFLLGLMLAIIGGIMIKKSN